MFNNISNLYINCKNVLVSKLKLRSKYVYFIESINIKKLFHILNNLNKIMK